MAMLDFMQTQTLLKKYGLPISPFWILTEKGELPQGSKHPTSYPIVIKAFSPRIIHKSEAGAVNSAIQSKEQLSETGRRMRAQFPESTLVVQPQFSGIEIIIGAKKDAQFGMVIVFGLGGIFTELLKDVSMRVAPITRQDAKEMISEIRSAPLLDGYRGRSGIRKEALVDILLAFSRLVVSENQKGLKITELDLNPVICDSTSAIIIDARIIVEEEPQKEEGV